MCGHSRAWLAKVGLCEQSHALPPMCSRGVHNGWAAVYGASCYRANWQLEAAQAGLIPSQQCPPKPSAAAAPPAATEIERWPALDRQRAPKKQKRCGWLGGAARHDAVHAATCMPPPIACRCCTLRPAKSSPPDSPPPSRPCSAADDPPLHGPQLLQRLQELGDAPHDAHFPPGTRVWWASPCGIVPLPLLRQH